jgi:cyclic di-GMP phosphodiesterase
MALADVYDTLISARPCKPAIGHDDAVAFISEQRGILFDPEELERIAEKFPD